MQKELERILARTSSAVSWSVTIRCADEVRASVAPERALGTASMGKVFLLAAASRQFAAGELERDARLEVSPEDYVRDSGLWQFLSEKQLSAESIASLIGALSDNLATNALLRRVGLKAVQQVSEDLGFPHTSMLDRIRDERSREHPEDPSRSRSADLAAIMMAIANGNLLDPGVSKDVEHWLSLNTDLSMVASAFDIDPLAHADGTAGIRFFNKTGTDSGVRADSGHLGGATEGWSYAAVANWDGSSELVNEVMTSMREIGATIRRASSHFLFG